MTTKLIKFQGQWVKVNPKLSAPNEWRTIINKSYIKCATIKQGFTTIWIMRTEKLYELDIDELENFLDYCEQAAAKLEVTVDYYIAEFVWSH